MELGLEGRVALVTGASAGLGKATVTTLAREGARVVLTARGEQRLHEVAGALAAEVGEERVLAVPGDVTVPAHLDAMFTAIGARFGGLDILVNNAGAVAHGPFLDIDDDAWQADLDLKLLAAIRCSRLALPLMRARGGGRIVNILNIGARQPSARSVPTSVSRAAGLALTKALSKEFAADNVLVTAVLPGLVKSDQWVRRWDAEGRTMPIEDWYERMGVDVPLGRVADAEELADLVAFLVSDRARFITGVAINFDGGQSAVI